jgi:S1-C subfamily serine protease
MIETAIATQFLEGQATEAEKLAAVTPPVAPQAPLRDAELAIIDVFEKSTRGVVNIFDLSLQGRAAPTADAPEGNGSGFVWSRQGHIVSNYHVLGSILRGLGPNAAQRGDVKVLFCRGLPWELLMLVHGEILARN